MKKFVRKWFLPPGIYQLLVDAPPPVKRLWEWGWEASVSAPGRAPVTLDFRSEEPASLDHLRVAPFEEIVWVPVEKVRVWGRGLSREQNQFVRYLSDGLASLERFYDYHQPKNQMERLFLPTASSAFFKPVRFPLFYDPWTFPLSFTGEGGLGWEHGAIDFGPVSKKRLMREAARVDLIRESVSRKGFQKLGTHIIYFGELLIDDRVPDLWDYRVCVAHGNHRTSLLGYLGWPLIPMEPHPAWRMREVRLSQVEHWPGVLDGTYSVNAAKAYFLSYFRDPGKVLLPGW